jgi:hypothetical protein
MYMVLVRRSRAGVPSTRAVQPEEQGMDRQRRPGRSSSTVPLTRLSDRRTFFSGCAARAATRAARDWFLRDDGGDLAADIDSALQRLQLDGVLYNDDLTAERITTMLRRRLEHPKVADWFSDRWTLFSECTILSIVDGQVVERRPDRVMTDGHEWVVVDFKFGNEHAEYHDQVRQYMELLRQMGHTSISGFLWYVYANRIVEVTS